MLFQNYNKFVTIQEAERLAKQIERYKPQIEQTLESVFVISKIISDEDDFEKIQRAFPNVKIHYNVDNMSFEFKQHVHPVYMYLFMLIVLLGTLINLMIHTGALLKVILISV